MPEIVIPDDFYPGISIQRNLRRSPGSLLTLHEELLQANGFRTNRTDVAIALSASKGLYSFLSDKAEGELKQYASQYSEKGRPIRGPVVVQFDLVIQILSQVLQYVKQHPRESLESAAAFAVIEDYLERKLGRVATAMWRKVSARKAKSTPRREIIRLIQIERITETRPKRKMRSRSTSSPKVKTKRHS